jgi:hypothetical protein
MPFSGADQTASRAFLATIIAVLCCLAGFSISTENHVADQSAQVKSASGLNQLYGDAWLRISLEQSLTRKYRTAPGQAVLKLVRPGGAEAQW